MNNDKEMQVNEILALTSIFDACELNVDPDDSSKLSFLANISLSHLPYNVLFEGKQFPIQTLPPIIMNVKLPVDYPSAKPPDFSLSCIWLSSQQLRKICKKLDKLWHKNPGEEVLFQYFSLLKDEVLQLLDLTEGLELRANNKYKMKHGKDRSDKSLKHQHSADSRIQKCRVNGDALLSAIIDFDSLKQKDLFNTKIIDCKICIQSCVGANCMSFVKCGHAFCKDCLQGYFTCQIKDGQVRQLVCPMEACHTEASPDMVKSLVDADLYARYDQLLLTHSLDDMTDCIQCPRPSCRLPVLFDRNENLANCSGCRFVFCPLCRMGYHGVAPCRIKAEELLKLRNEYLNGNVEERSLLEQRYGKKAIQMAVEEGYSLQWLSDYSKQCPKCQASIQKVDGCNKMTCGKCGVYFCWLCLQALPKSDPYEHFQNPKSKCSDRLFEGLEEEERQGGNEIFDDDWFSDDSDFEFEL